LVARLGEGDVFGYRIAHQDIDAQYSGMALEDCLLYQMDASDVDDLCDVYPQLGYFFAPLGGNRLRSSIAPRGHGSSAYLNLLTTSVREIVDARPSVQVSPDASIQETAAIMSAQGHSSAMVFQGDHLFGVVTDRDLRNRVVSKGMYHGLPIMEIATVAPLTISVEKTAFEALLTMARHNIHHLPVVDGHRIMGMITATDLTERHSTSAIYLAGNIYNRKGVDGLKEASNKVTQMFENLAAAEASAQGSGFIMSAISDAFAHRLIQLAEQKLGPPPVNYAWVAAGSQGRSEQTAHSDQDNCLILDDAYDPERHVDYFREFATFVCDGLNACGYEYCPGEMMAMTDEWRQPLRRWKEYFAKWIDAPEPKALMLSCIFFDLRFIHGTESLFKELRQFVLERSRGNRIFLAFMAGNALKHQPPLGFFRNFVLIRGGDHHQTFDLKHNGVIPIVDLGRIYALAGGNDEVNTQERLRVAETGSEVSESAARDLQDALEYISKLRIEHQARLLRLGKEANNFISPNDLSNFERNRLKDAFSVVRTLQSVLSTRYQTGRF
jgi:CBS domain-containing protein